MNFFYLWYIQTVEERIAMKINEPQNLDQGFPGVLLVKNSPASAGDMGSIPELGRSHMPRSN